VSCRCSPWRPMLPMVTNSAPSTEPKVGSFDRSYVRRLLGQRTRAVSLVEGIKPSRFLLLIETYYHGNFSCITSWRRTFGVTEHGGLQGLILDGVNMYNAINAIFFPCCPQFGFWLAVRTACRPSNCSASVLAMSTRLDPSPRFLYSMSTVPNPYPLPTLAAQSELAASDCT
jgi:hypothetical protein